jgi:Uma2 family endonuclease
MKGANRPESVPEFEPMSSAVPRAEPVASTEPGAHDGAILPLESGDRLTRDEFERRYATMPPDLKCELVEGVVYVASPVRQRHHGRPHSHLQGWLCQYEASTPGVESGDNSTARLDLINEPQPDGVLFVKPEHGGQVQIDPDGYLAGAPDLVAEITASTASYDLHDKLQAFLRTGVREYLVVRVRDRQVDWLVLREGQYRRLEPAPDGSLRSTVFPGLWLDPAALLRGDLPAVLALVQQGVASPEHAEFAAWLRQAQAQSNAAQ